MTTGRQYQVVWYVQPHPDLIQMSHVLSGLASLAHRRIVSLTLEVTDRTPELPAVMELKVTHTKPALWRKVIIDFHDREGTIFPAALDWADVYFKRQYGPQTAVAAASAAHKVRPLGLTMAGFTLGTGPLLIAAISAQLRAQWTGSSGQGLPRLLPRVARDAWLWLRLQSPKGVVTRTGDIKKAAVVFQPRLWDIEAGCGDVFDLANRDRIATVRALRSAFPGLPTIGLTHTAAAKRYAPELLLGKKVTTGEYHSQLRSSAIGVNCAGLADSVGWKLAEYLAAGCAVVSNPITKELPAPLLPEVHYLPYSTPEECVDQCRRLLASDAVASRMGMANHEYYRQWVDPPALALQFLRTVFD